MKGGKFWYQRGRSGKSAVVTLVLVVMWHEVLCRVVVVEMFEFDKVPSGRNCNW